MEKRKGKELDLHDYDSPIKRADGVVPYNDYLWPTESWWPSHTRQFRSIPSQLHFGIIELNDGRFAIDGFLRSIKLNDADWIYREEGEPHKPRPVVFATRREAIRTAAARMLRLARHARHWQGLFNKLSEVQFINLYAWTMEAVSKALAEPPGKLVKLSIPEPVDRSVEGLELFDNARK